MANCNSIFHDYNNQIRLSDDKRIELIKVRDNLRLRMNEGYLIVSKTFKTYHKLEFQSQGSFVMDTIIKPLRDDYDLDDGIYFFGSMKKHNRPLPKEFHQWVIQSLDRGHDDVEEILDKDTCVRVKYKSGFHIDLPIYYTENFETPDLADKERGWILSNPIEFIEWFETKIKSGFEKAFLYETRMLAAYEKWSVEIRKQDHQLRRIVRYLKSWGDLRREEMPCGLVMTILAANNYYAHDRDDISLKETLVNIHSALSKHFACERPTTPAGEDLLSTYKHKDVFMNYLSRFIENAKKGLAEPDEKSSCDHWKKSLGDRFSCDSAKSQTKSNGATSGLMIGAATSRPWC